jgi:hypothetical protein
VTGIHVRSLTLDQAIARQRVRLRRAERTHEMTLDEAWERRRAGDMRWQVCDVLEEGLGLNRLIGLREEAANA